MLKPLALSALATVAIFAATAAVSASSSENLLANPGFETGDTSGWSVLNGSLSSDSSSNTGLWSANLTSDGQTTVARFWQLVPVQPYASYQFSGWTLIDDASVDYVIIRIQWLNSGGNLVGEEDSPWLVNGMVESGTFTFASTHSVPAPATAVSARVQGLVFGVDSDTFHAYFDDLSFIRTAPAPATPVLSQAPAPSATPVATTPATSAPLQTRTPTPTARPSTSTPSSRPGESSPAMEPAVFSSLTNGGFEEAEQDGAYGWRKVGGTVARDTGQKRSGAYSAALTSSTTSTKWLYQTVSVQEGRYYRAAAFAQQNNPQPGEIFLRLSWYASPDGSGTAISNNDSAETISTNSAGFVSIVTDPGRVPAGAQSVRVRLMFRPADAMTASVYFDDVTFAESPPPEGVAAAAASSGESGYSRENVRPAADAPADAGPGAAAGAPFNGGPAISGKSPTTATTAGSDNWLLLLAIGIPIIGIGAVLGVPYVRRKLGRGAPPLA